jgi:Holliday junction DNA helicase RuvA
MIAYLKGRIIQKTPAQVTLDVGGVGYCAAIPLSTYFQLGEEKSLCELQIYTHLTDSSLASRKRTPFSN